MTHHKIISTTVTSTVVLDAGFDLLVTPTGHIAPAAAGTAALIITKNAVGSRIVNRGLISGGAGRSSKSTLSGGVGGNGIADLATASITNAGQITGGTGGASTSQPAGAGGRAILLAAGSTIGNTGTITGGLGGAGSAGGSGGVGIQAADNALITNRGTITGGAGGVGSTTNGTQYLGTGAAAIVLSTGDVLSNAGAIVGGANLASTSGTASAGLVAGLDDRIANAGTIVGGYGFTGTIQLDPYETAHLYGTGGAGVAMNSFSYLTNRGQIVGGTAGVPDGSGGLPPIFVATGTGGYGLWMRDGSTTNFGTIAGGFGGAGGVALAMLAGTVVNLGDIKGGDAVYYGAMGGPYSAGPGGVGLMASGRSTIDNSGTIAGGYGGSTFGFEAAVGGNAVVLSDGSELINRGYILGGEAGGAIAEGAGLGAVLTTGASLINYGVIAAGGGYTTGGAGLTLATGSTVSNYGTITGAKSTPNFYNETKPGSLGGDGVDMAGGKLFSSGVIAGGAGAAYDSPFQPNFTYGGNGGNGITVTGGTLVAAGTFVGGAGGMGTASNGLQGDAVAITADNNTLILRPTASFYGLVAASGQNDTLELTGTGGRLIGLGTEYTGFQTVEEDAGAAWSFGLSNFLGTATNLQIDGSLTVSGSFGDSGLATIAASGLVIDTGSLYFLNVSNSGTILDRGDLTLGTLTGNGQVTLAANSRLEMYPGGTASQTIAFAGPNSVVDLYDPTALLGTISGFGFADTIDFLYTKLTSATFASGALTVFDGRTAVATLHLQGDYTSSSFTLASDGHGGTWLKI